MNKETQKVLDYNNQMFRDIFGFDVNLLDPTPRRQAVQFLPVGDGTCNTEDDDLPTGPMGGMFHGRATGGGV